jgi:tape measure domain-containing protein
MATSIAKLAILLTTDTSGMARGFNAAQGMVGEFDTKSKVLNATLTATKVGLAALATGAVVVVREGIRMAAVMEQVQVSLEVMSGSAKTGRALLMDLWSFSRETPLSFEEVMRSGKVLMAMGDSAGQASQHMRVLGDVAAGTGQPLHELAQVFGQVQQAGRLTGNELRQFNERGVPVLTELSKMMGVSKQAIRDMVEEGKIGSDEVVKAFERMTAAGGQFENMLERQADTLSGQWGKFKDSFSMASFEAVGGSSGWLKKGLEATSGFLSDVADGFRMVNSMPLPEMAFDPRGIMMLAEAEKRRKSEIERELRVGDDDERRRDRESLSARIAEEHAEKMKAMKKEADKITKSLFTPDEVMADHLTDAKTFLEHGLIDLETYRRQVENIKDEYLKAAGAADKMSRSTPLGANPAHDIRSTAGISAMNAARAEMQRIAREQETSNKHLAEMKTIMDGVRKNTADRSSLVLPVAHF